MVKHFLILAPLAFLAGCSAPIGSMPSQTPVVVSNTVDALEYAGAAYLQLPLCSSAVLPCRTQAGSQAIYSAAKTLRVARDNVKNFARNNPGAPIPIYLQDAVTAGTSILQSALVNFSK